jgi:hypothetical protein
MTSSFSSSPVIFPLVSNQPHRAFPAKWDKILGHRISPVKNFFQGSFQRNLQRHVNLATASDFQSNLPVPFGDAE